MIADRTGRRDCVIPAQAGIQQSTITHAVDITNQPALPATRNRMMNWIPAFAGMTSRNAPE